jgi:amino acid transporter
MINVTNSPSSGSLKKVLGFSSLFAVAIGSVAAQSSFVSLLNGTGSGGGTFFMALFIAFILTICCSFSFLELSLMMPKAGGMGTFTAVAGGHFLSIGVILGGYVGVVAFSGPAELMLLESIVGMVYPGIFSHLGLLILIMFTILNLLGINIFSSIQNLLVYVLLVALLVIGFTGLNNTSANGIILDSLSKDFVSKGASSLSLIALALWSFTGLEYICPFVEESKNPRKNLPKAMLLAAVMLLFVYGMLSYAGLKHVPLNELAESEIPHWLLVESLFGNTAGFVMVVFAITATSSVTNTVLASIPRMLFGMALNGQVPAIFGRLHPKWNTPWFGILIVFCLIGVPLVLLSNAKDYILLMLISATTFWLVAYIIAHLNVLVLRKKYPTFNRPFKTPLYPLPQILGILGMAFAIWNNSPSINLSRQVYINSGLMFLGISLYSFLWVKYKMKKGIFETEPIEDALTG